MADTTHTDRAYAWNTVFHNLCELNQRLEKAHPHEREALERALAEQEEDVLNISAPSFSAVVSKLYILWDAKLVGLDPETEAKRLIIEDLERLVRESAELLVSDVDFSPPPPGWQRI